MSRLLALILLLLPMLAEADIPLDCQRYQRLLTRTAQAEWGLNAPISVFAAQMRAESACNPAAISPAGARGLSQFMPGTARDMARWYPQLRGFDPHDPQQALAALVLYDRRIYGNIKGSANICNRWAFTLHGYNAGPGWVTRDRRLTAQRGGDPGRWFDNTEHHSRRNPRARRETQHYVRRILIVFAPQFQAAGWGGPRICPWSRE